MTSLQREMRKLRSPELKEKQIVLHNGTIYTRVIHLSRTGHGFMGICSEDGLAHRFLDLHVSEIRDPR
jgi:hypothetical protein